MNNVTRLRTPPRPPRNEVPDIEKETEKLLEVAAELRDTIDRLFHAHTLMTAVEYATANEALFAISEHAYVIQSMATDHTCGAP